MGGSAAEEKNAMSRLILGTKTVKKDDESDSMQVSGY